MATLVTGGFGAIGAWLVRELVEHGEDVAIFARADRSDRLEDIRGSFIVELGDICDVHQIYKALLRTRVERICHLAARLDGPHDEQPLSMIDVNVRGTANLLEAARHVGIRNFVMASSKAVYGPARGAYGFPAYEPIPETAPLRPIDFYGATKVAAEQVLQVYSDQFQITGTALRFGSTFGPGKGTASHGSYGVVSAMIENAWKGQPYQVSGADQRSDYIYYRDIARALRLALERSGDPYEVFNIATGRGLSIYEITDKLHRMCENADIGLSGGLQYRASEPSMAFVLAVDRAREKLGFKASYDMDAAINDYGKWLLDAGH